MTGEEWLCEVGAEGAVIFSNPDFDDAIIGITTDDRVVYDYDLMVQCLTETDGMDCESAIEFIEFNTIRSLGYLGNEAPVVVHSRITEQDTADGAR